QLLEITNGKRAFQTRADLLEPLLGARAIASHQALKDRFLARIIGVDRTCRDANFLGDLTDIGAMESLRCKQLEGSVHDPALVLFDPTFGDFGHDKALAFPRKLIADYTLQPYGACGTGTGVPAARGVRAVGWRHACRCLLPSKGRFSAGKSACATK